MQYDIIADWNLNKFCNFRCPYCFLSSGDRGNENYRGNDTQKALVSFNNLAGNWFIHMSGGEPFLHPDFISLCKGLTKQHHISLNTNLSSQLVYDFCREIDPGRVSFVHCSLHIIEREHKTLVDDFIEKVRALEQSAFNVYITQVMWPPVLERFPQIFEYFQEEGILVRPKLFRGNYKGAEYPQSYSAKEKSTVLKFMRLIEEDDSRSGKTLAHINPNLEKLWINGYVSFKNSPCLAGVKFVMIDFHGNVRRCYGESTKLGNIYQGTLKLLEDAEPCHAKICSCPYYGVIYSNGNPKTVKSRLPVFIQKLMKRN